MQKWEGRGQGGAPAEGWKRGGGGQGREGCGGEANREGGKSR